MRTINTPVFEEAAEKVFQHVSAKLPKNVIKKIDTKGRLKAEIHSCAARNFTVLFNRLKTNGFDTETSEGCLQVNHSPFEMDGADLFYPEISLAGNLAGGQADKFHEEAYGDSLDELKKYTNTMLDQRADTGTIIGSADTYSVLRCVFKNNARKPETVTDMNLLINFFDTDFFNPAFPNRLTAEFLNDLITKKIIDAIDDVIVSELNASGEKGPGLPEGQKILEMLGSFEIDPECIDADVVSKDTFNISYTSEIYSNGFKNTVDWLATVLENFNMGYQYIDRFSGMNEVTIREYEETNDANLPDENFRIKLNFYSKEDLTQERLSYDKRLACLQTEVQRLWNIMEVIYQDSKSIFRVNDFEDLDKKNRNRVKKLIKEKASDPLYEDLEKTWDEYTMVNAPQTPEDAPDCKNTHEKSRIYKRLARMRERFYNMCGSMYQSERKVMEERLSLLEKEFSFFDAVTNPYLIQSGILLEVNATSIKRKKTTLDTMSKVLNEFLSGVSRAFDEAAAVYPRTAP